MEERAKIYVKICERAEKLEIQQNNKMGALMDIESADLMFNLRLNEWLHADDFNFTHDFCGIQNNINRTSFPASNFGLFVPRFSSLDKIFQKKGKIPMNKLEAKKVLKIWLSCPVRLGGNCNEECPSIIECWSRKQIEEAVNTIIKDEKETDII